MNAHRLRLAGLFAAAAASVAVISIAGCSKQPQAKPLSPEAFINPRSGTANMPGENGNMAPGTTQGGNVGPGEAVQPNVAVPTNTVAQQINNALGKPIPTPPPDPRGNGGTKSGVSDVVESQVKPVGPVTSATGPARVTTGTNGLPPIGASSGQYMTVGGVVAEVNGTPIYANKVLALLDKPFREKARQLDANTFRRQAMEDIRKTIRELAMAELEYAAAQRNLDMEDRRYADAATIYWRQQKITQASGSLELARRASLSDPDNPMDFDEKTVEQNRVELVKIFYQKKVYPKIQVSAADIREYYDKNVDKEFTENERVEFRIIKVDIQRSGGKEQAIKKARDLYERAARGEDFKELATKENDERMFAGDKPFEVAPKSFAIEKVREALTTLKPGEVSQPIEDRDGWYIVKLEKRQGGVVHPFDEQKVQDTIRFKLKSEQFRVLREQVQMNLMKGAVMTPDIAVLAGAQAPSPTDAQRFNIALDMAMQRYAAYAAVK
jgi:hypothetical protein